MNLCLDACFLIGLYDERDQHHARSKQLFLEHFETASNNVAVIVWPVLYESVSTRLVRSSKRLSAMESDWRILVSTNRLVFVSDEHYRDAALDSCLEEPSKTRTASRTLSLTDRVLRAVLADRNTRVDAILTFNTADFADVCRKSRRQIVS